MAVRILFCNLLKAKQALLIFLHSLSAGVLCTYAHFFQSALLINAARVFCFSPICYNFPLTSLEDPLIEGILSISIQDRLEMFFSLRCLKHDLNLNMRNLEILHSGGGILHLCYYNPYPFEKLIFL